MRKRKLSPLALKGKLKRYFGHGLQLPAEPGQAPNSTGLNLEGKDLRKWPGKTRTMSRVLRAYPVLQVKFAVEPNSNRSATMSLPLSGSPGKLHVLAGGQRGSS